MRSSRTPATTTPRAITLGAVLALALLGGCTVAGGGERDVAPRESSALSALPAALDLEPIGRSRLCVTAGHVDALDDRTLEVDAGGMRGVVAGDGGRSAEVAFVYPGPSREQAPLANGELRRQIGLKLRAQDACNVVYVMWHVEPTPGIHVSVKHNPGQRSHEDCGARGYTNLRPAVGASPAPIRAGEPHTLRADLDGDVLTVLADGELAWKGIIPAEASTFDGPAGIRSDNGHFDFELRVPGGSRPGPLCPGGQPVTGD